LFILYFLPQTRSCIAIAGSLTAPYRLYVSYVIYHECEYNAAHGHLESKTARAKAKDKCSCDLFAAFIISYFCFQETFNCWLWYNFSHHSRIQIFVFTAILQALFFIGSGKCHTSIKKQPVWLFAHRLFGSFC